VKLLLTPGLSQLGGLHVRVEFNDGVIDNPTPSMVGPEYEYGEAGIVMLTSRLILPLAFWPVTMQEYLVSE
jgi:hypothetical protein